MSRSPTFIQQLRATVDIEILQLQAVATGEADIRAINAEYRERRSQIRSSLRQLGLSDPNPWSDLWLWHGYYKKSSELSTYQARREHIIIRYQPLLEALDRLEDRQVGTGLERPTTGWTKVDEQTSRMREAYAVAKTAEDFQVVGLRCRDLLISVGEAVYDRTRHSPVGEPPLKAADAKGRLRQVIDFELRGERNERARQLLKSLIEGTWNLSVNLQHDREAREAKAMMVASCTIVIVDLLRSVIPEPSGQGEPETEYEEFVESARSLPGPQDYEPDEVDLRYLAELAIREDE